MYCSYFLYNLDIDAYNSSMAISCLASWLPMYHLASSWLQLPPISTCLLLGFICNTKLVSHHSIHPMTMLIVRNWIVHLTPIPCSLFQFCPNLAGFHTMCIIIVTWFVPSHHLKVCASSGSVMHGQDEMACHLHLILCTWDPVTTCTSFSLYKGCGYGHYARNLN